MLIHLLGISQVAYPKKVVIDNDTVCIVSIPQIKIVNKVFIDRDELRELNDSLNSELSNYRDLAEGQKQIIITQDQQKEIKDKIILEKDVIIQSDEKLAKKQNRQIGWLKLQRNVLAISALVLSVTLVILKN